MRPDTKGHMTAASFFLVAAAQKFAAVKVLAKNVEAFGLLEDALIVVCGEVDHLHQ